MTVAVDQLCFDLPMDGPVVSRKRPAVAHTAAPKDRQMSFRLSPPVHSTCARKMRGAVAYRAGLEAEDQVARAYMRTGAVRVADRWRGKAGEIDLILRDASGLVFVEVKRARTHDTAVSRVSQRQKARLYLAAEEYAGATYPGQLVDMRFDVATVDAQGGIIIRHNAFA